MTRNLAALSLLTLLAACGTPQQQCISRQTGEYRNVSALLAEVEGNIARGYAWAERPVRSVEWRDCSRVVRARDGRAAVVSRPCLRDVVETERYRVPIDPAAEARKRDGLIAQRTELRSRAEVGIRACRAAYPED